MGVPKQRKTKARQGNRRSHHALSAVTILSCPKCGKEVLPHRLCENCGTYKQREVVNVLAKLDKKERKRREKEQKEYEKEHPQEESPASGTMEELSKKPETKTEDKTINKKSLKFSNIEIVKLLPIFYNVRHKKIILFLIFYYQTLTCWKS